MSMLAAGSFALIRGTALDIMLQALYINRVQHSLYFMLSLPELQTAAPTIKECAPIEAIEATRLPASTPGPSYFRRRKPAGLR